MKYYLAGPMSGHPEHNFPEFQRIARELRYVDIEVFSPHEIDHGESVEERGSKPCAFYMKHDLKAMLDCDAIVCHGKWWKSKGAMIELELAYKLDMPIFFYDGTLPFRKLDWEPEYMLRRLPG